MRYYSDSFVPKWDIYQITVHAPESADPFAEGVFGAVFEGESGTYRIPGFYDGDDTYRVRFMPRSEGEWRYVTYGSASGTAGHTGAFTCTPAEDGVHGPVHVSQKYHFAYEDGTVFMPFGTTCYVWTYQSDDRRRQTVETMRNAPFNKMRMCVFPKNFVYNHAEPRMFPFERKSDGGFRFDRPDPAFFRDYEEQIAALENIGVETEVILFHPYDRGKWGFDSMPLECDIRYLRYFIARTAAFRGIWWSMANEFDIMRALTDDDWDRLGRFVRDEDPYGHPISIHNCVRHYDVTRPWITHASVQRVDTYRTTEDALILREKWQKPIVWDEICYEGNIPSGWGCVDAEELVRRYWEAAVRESYPCHGETFIDPEGGDDQLLWWSHGGTLRGRSIERIRFLRGIMESAPGRWAYRLESFDLPAAHIGNDYHLYYFGFMVPCGRDICLPAGRYRVEVIDTWEMTITDLGVTEGTAVDEEAGYFLRLEGKEPGEYRKLYVPLPGKRYMAIRITKA